MWATPTIAGPSGRARIHRGARDIDPDKVYGSKGQSDGDPGQLYGRASLRHPKNANEKRKVPINSKIKAEIALYSPHVV